MGKGEHRHEHVFRHGRGVDTPDGGDGYVRTPQRRVQQVVDAGAVQLDPTQSRYLRRVGDG